MEVLRQEGFSKQDFELITAALEGHEQIVRTLLDRDAKIEAADNDERTPLGWHI